VTGTFNIFEKGFNVVVGKSGGTTHGSGFNFERLSLLYRGALGEGHSKSFVHNRFEWTAGPPRFSLETRSDIGVQSKCRSHASRCYQLGILMSIERAAVRASSLLKETDFALIDFELLTAF
jgi:hypothetical protein